MPAPKKDEKPFRVVITGGPCAGKTEIWKFLGSRFPSAVMVPETASELILSGRSQEVLGLKAFQQRLFQLQREREDDALKKNPFLLIDRGLADGKAYDPDLFASVHVSAEEVLGRYDLVLHLEVLQDPGAYKVHAHTNPARKEGHEEALKLDRAIHAIYRAHPAYFFLEGSLESKKSWALRIVSGIMGSPEP